MHMLDFNNFDKIILNLLKFDIMLLNKCRLSNSYQYVAVEVVEFFIDIMN